MYIKSKGVTLLEMCIVMAIFTVVSVGVTNLSIKAIDQQRDQQSATYHNHLYNEVQEDLRRDLRSAFAVTISNNGGAAPANTDYIVQQACGGAHPNGTAGTGNTLNIVRQVDYDESVPQNTFDYIRYQFVTEGGRNYLVRLVNQNVVVPGDPGDLWPKDPTDATHVPSYSSFTNIAGTNMPSKVYNVPDVTSEDHDLTGTFSPRYGSEFSPPTGSAVTNCSFFITTVDINNLTMTAAGHNNRFDRKFGKTNLISPTMSFEINSSLKFF